MHPKAEASIGGSDEVGVPVGDAEIVHRRELACRTIGFNSQPRGGFGRVGNGQIDRGQHVPGQHFTGGGPAAVFDEDGVLGRDLDHAATRAYFNVPGLQEYHKSSYSIPVMSEFENL